MKNVEIYRYNGYCTNDKGENFRAVAVTEDGKSVWRLAKETKPGYQWDFVNDVQYTSCVNALNVVRMMELMEE